MAAFNAWSSCRPVAVQRQAHRESGSRLASRSCGQRSQPICPTDHLRPLADAPVRCNVAAYAPRPLDASDIVFPVTIRTSTLRP